MTLLAIPEMSCGHCKAAVEAALASVKGAQDIQVDLQAREASVQGNVLVADLLAAVAAAGYPATVKG